MPFEWDEAKRTSNLAKHGVDFADVEAWEWSLALTRADLRGSSDDVRLVSLVPSGDALFFVAFTIRRSVRVISARRANNKEIRWYEANP